MSTETEGKTAEQLAAEAAAAADGGTGKTEAELQAEQAAADEAAAQAEAEDLVALLTELVATINRGDGAGAASRFAEDGEILGPRPCVMNPCNGRAAI